MQNFTNPALAIIHEEIILAIQAKHSGLNFLYTPAKKQIATFHIPRKGPYIPSSGYPGNDWEKLKLALFMMRTLGMSIGLTSIASIQIQTITVHFEDLGNQPIPTLQILLEHADKLLTQINVPPDISSLPTHRCTQCNALLNFYANLTELKCNACLQSRSSCIY